MNIQEIKKTLAVNPEFAAHAERRIGELLTRSATDEDFRSLLLSDSRTAIAEFTGREVPEDVEIRFVESEDSSVDNQDGRTIVLPDPVDLTAEIADDELEAVAGGVVVGGCIPPLPWPPVEWPEVFPVLLENILGERVS